MTRELFIAALVLSGACGGTAPSRVDGAPTTPPDESYQLGSVGHQEGFIWTCVSGKRVHLLRNCGEFYGCGAWHLHEGPCGAPIASEPDPGARKPMRTGHWE